MDIKFKKQTINRINNYREMCNGVSTGKLIRIMLDYIEDNEDDFFDWWEIWAESQYGVNIDD